MARVRSVDLKLGNQLGVAECAKIMEKGKKAEDLAPGNGKIREYKKEYTESWT